jgi:2-dehydro-3-deoxygluconokinase
VPESCDVLCVGETMVMVTPAEGGPLRTGASYLLHPGGAESNVATHLAALGHASAWASYLSDDALGDLIREELTASGVDVSLVKRFPGAPTGVYFKDPRPMGTRILYYRTGSAASKMQASYIAEWAPLTPKVIHLSGITSALSLSCRELIRDLILNRAVGDALISFDVNHRPPLWEEREAGAELLKLAQASDIVFVGRDEAESLWGVSTAESIRNLIDGPPSLVVKDGGNEAISFTQDGVTRVSAMEIDVIEPIGAGDAFAAGWLSGMLRNVDQPLRLQLGHLLASRVLASTTDTAEPLSEKEVTDSLRSPTPQAI